MKYAALLLLAWCSCDSDHNRIKNDIKAECYQKYEHPADAGGEWSVPSGCEIMHVQCRPFHDITIMDKNNHDITIMDKNNASMQLKCVKRQSDGPAEP
jgi:hypothetical protein